MALAYGGFQGLNHQLRFLLFELGIGLPQHSIDSFISTAHRQCLQQLRQIAVIEGLSDVLLPSHHVYDFLAQLQKQLKQENPASLFFNWQVLHEEIEAAIANEAMAQVYRQRWQRELKRQIGTERNFWEWLCKDNNAHEAFELLEQWGCIGFTYYPGLKAKLGFSRREVLQYSPEFNAQLSLHWCAIDKAAANTDAGKLGYQELIKRQFSEEYKLWQEKLRFKQQNPDNFYPLPVHPWQWRNQLQHSFASLLDNKQLILLPHHQSVKPSLAISSMMPQAKNASYLNLSLDLDGCQPIASMANYSKELNQLLEKHQHYQKSLLIVEKLAELTVDGNAIPSYQQKQLAVALSENPNQKIQEGQRLVPLAALFADSPSSEAPLLLEIIAASNLCPLSYFQQYCQKLLEGQLHLLLQYGLALAGDWQTTLILIHENQPQAIVFRGFNQLAICQQPIYQQQRLGALSSMTTSTLKEVCQQFIQTNLQNNLSLWINCLSRSYGLEPLKLWQVVACTIKSNFARLTRGIPAEVSAFQYEQLMSAPREHICFLSMKLQRKQQKIHQLVPNFLDY
ncbi:FrgA protein [Legionella nautarum]|uniref:FrgA protein n=1 Tax=Legionella nautarum TaxID=45070 RepID=A0A0W0WLB5_9GAMM|nr:IucA/IucC family protein [Legionella nautarum]KTD33089.1 FrgA protein [Legionella nautarum]